MGSTEKVVEYIEECRRMTLLDGSRGIRVFAAGCECVGQRFHAGFIPKAAPVKGRKAKPQDGGGYSIWIGGRARGWARKRWNTFRRCEKKKGDFAKPVRFLRAAGSSAGDAPPTIEALIKCGAFSSTKAKRSQLLQILEARS